MDQLTSDAHAGGVMPTDWLRWSVAGWIGMIAIAALLVGAVVMLFRDSWVAVPLGAFAILTPLIAAIDLRWRVVPNRLVLPAVLAIAALAALTGLVDGDASRILGCVAGGAGMFALYLALALIAPQAMGMGDVKLAALIGAVLGMVAWPAWWMGVLAGFLAGAIFGIAGLAARRVSRHSRLPYAPAMLVGAWVGIVSATIRP